VAILNDYNSRWSLDWQPHHQDFDYVKHLIHYYQYFASRNIPVDILAADEPLQGYRLVIAPSLTITNAEQIEHFTSLLAKGGTLIVTLRSGVKDEYNALLPSRPPGPLGELTNVEVEEYYALDTAVPVKGNFFNGIARTWAERLNKIMEEKLMQPVATYRRHNGWLDGQMAIAVNSYKRGYVFYVGAYLDEHANAELLNHICKIARVKPVLETRRGVEACQRITAEGQEVLLLINHESSPKQVAIPWEAIEHLSGNRGKGDLTLTPYGVAILTKAPAQEPDDELEGA
jgi:beta-galactosidase